MHEPTPERDRPEEPWWSGPVEQLARELQASPQGLSSAEAALRLQRHGPNALQAARGGRVAALLWRQFGSPIVLVLIGAALLSFALHDAVDGAIILAIVGASALLGFWQEFRASTAVAALQRLVAPQAEVLRDGAAVRLPQDQVVPGDVIVLSAGASVAADARLLAARDLFVNEATLTGETFPVEKAPAELPAGTALAGRGNALFRGTHVVSGSGRALVVHTGRDTQFGAIAERLRLRAPETDFERGVRRFGLLLLRLTLVLVILIFAFNVGLQRPVLDSFLFALALAVGLTPELLPAIISVNLASGARRMAERRVIVKRLVAIENFGSMDVLCSDKTGTLTEGRVRMEAALDAGGTPSERVLHLAVLNAALQTGFRNPIDQALVAAAPEGAAATAGATRLDEIPYDFVRKRLSVLVAQDGEVLMVTKGALAQVLAVCTAVQRADGSLQPLPDAEAGIQARFAEFSARGLRALGLATKALPGRTGITRDDEAGLVFAGFLLFADPPKAGIVDTLADLRGLGVALKVITGDNALVAQAVAARIRLPAPRVVSGPALREVGDDALAQLASRTDVFAEVEPNQKERIIRALRHAGHVVGYMGDGINDAPALRAADVGLSVQGAADVAKEAADIVLMESDLAVLAAGVREGRSTFANTQKYVFMASSANFGNMFSMAGASLLLPFLPLLPKQILLTNLLTDLPEMAMAGDRVDAQAVQRPQRWDVDFIHRFMWRFGLLSSLFDFVTFGVLFLALQATPELFRTGWFVESVLSAALVVLVLRTRGPLWRSRPSLPLLLATAGTAAVALALPYSPLAGMLGFAPLPAAVLGWMLLIVALYVAAAEGLKRVFYRSAAGRRHRRGRRPAR
ncbi:MAG: magnesium-translocating P-type ATPase [Rubrivivax sp.]|nr:magnesium-translocating P-type ATPase [Rubrivivax sp.]